MKRIDITDIPEDILRQAWTIKQTGNFPSMTVEDIARVIVIIKEEHGAGAGAN
jgi:hypothetical protein